MRLAVDVQGATEMADGLSAAANAVDRVMGETLRRGGELMFERVRSNAPGRAKTGVRTRTVGSGQRTRTEVYLAGVAIPVATGADPHVIAPSRRRALRIGTGFAARVQHPGSRGNDFLGEAVERARPDLQRALDAAAERIAKEVTDV